MRTLGAALAVSVVGLLSVPPPVALAQPVISVNDNRDALKALNSGANCVSTLGTCTLRAAIDTVNQTPADSGATIDVPSNLGTYALSSNPQFGRLTVRAPMTLRSADAGSPVIDGQGQVEVFDMLAGAPLAVVLSGLTLTRGNRGGQAAGGDIVTDVNLTLNGVNVTAGISATNAGGIYVVEGTLTMNGGSVSGNVAQTGAGIEIANTATLTATGTSFSNNVASQAGAAIRNSGTVVLNNVTMTQNVAIDGPGIDQKGVGSATITGGSLSQNTATGRGGAVFVEAGGALSITGTSFSGNTAAQGGGLYESGTATLTRATFSGNTATQGDGGGIAVEAGTATLANSTVSGNHASAGNGGGIASTASTVTVSGSTFDGNQAHGAGQGGGVYVTFSTDTYTNSTLSGNSADVSGGGAYASASTVSFDSATLAGNSAPTGAGIFIPISVTVNLHDSILADTGADCSAAATSLGYNIEGGNTCGLTGTGDKPSTDPKLGPLASNGGPTQTRALLAGSPAIDSGDPACPPPNTDQRGITRRQGPLCDIGAFEVTVPNLTGISPTSGPVAGGTIVTIRGTGFTDATQVSFGTALATQVTVVDDTTIAALSPAGAPGTVDVTVTTAAGTSRTVAADRFLFVAASPLPAPPPTGHPPRAG